MDVCGPVVFDDVGVANTDIPGLELLELRLCVEFVRLHGELDGIQWE